MSLGQRLKQFLCWGLMSWSTWAGAQSEANLRLLVGFSPGGGSDSVARLMAPKLGALLKQNVVIDNRTGAGGHIASEALYKAAGEDNLLMLGTIGSLAVNPHLIPMSFNPATDLVMVSLAVSFSNILVVPAASPIQNFADYVRAAKQPNTPLAFGSSGIGSAGHLAGEMLKHMAGLQYQHVPYRGGAPAMADLLSGVLPSIFSAPSDALTYIQAKKLRPLASTGTTRHEALPDVPTVAESGYAEYEALNWYAFAMPPKSKPEQVLRLSAAINEVLNDPAIVAQLNKMGMKPSPSTPEQAAQYVKRESDKWGQVIRQAKISGNSR